MLPRPNPWHLARLVPLAVLPVVLSATPGHAATPPSLDARVAEIELVDTALPKNAQTARFTLALEDQGSASLNLPLDGYRYDVRVRCQVPTNGKVPTALQLHRFDPHPGSPLAVSSSADLAMPLDAKKTVLAVQRPDGTRVEITLRLR